ncbi:MAG: hypothetical protein ACYC61_11100 [Isosphaeraceae bacterium]
MDVQEPTVGRAPAEEDAEIPREVWDALAAAQARPFIPLLPNLLATALGFLSLMAAPWVCLKIEEWALEDEIVSDKIAIWLAGMSWEDNAVVALIGAVLFLTIGAILQAWEHHRPFNPRWPVWLAFPIAVPIIVAEAVLRGGTVFSGAVAAVAVAVSFVIHWLTVVGLREALD